MIKEGKPALTFQIDQDYFDTHMRTTNAHNNGYTLLGSENVYTKTIAANNLDLSTDANG